jgi:hypothetical protein
MMCEEVTLVCFQVGVLFQHSLGVTDENHEKPIPLSWNLPHDKIIKKWPNYEQIKSQDGI